MKGRPKKLTPIEHPNALAAAERAQIIRFDPDMPCVKCGEPASVASVYRFQFTPLCAACVASMRARYDEANEVLIV